MVTLPQYVRDRLEDKSMPDPSTKGFYSPFGLSRKKIYWAVIWKKGLLICFEISYSRRQSRKSIVNTLLLMANASLNISDSNEI